MDLTVIGGDRWSLMPLNLVLFFLIHGLPGKRQRQEKAPKIDAVFSMMFSFSYWESFLSYECTWLLLFRWFEHE